jgi:hypothetical protein
MSSTSLNSPTWSLTGAHRRAGALASPRDGLVAVLTALVVCAVFVPALQGGFVDWDDYLNFLENPRYRGLGVGQISWMLGSIHTGHWIPMTWLTLGLDYVIWGLDPFGYHLTSVLLHGANAALFFLVAARLLSNAAVAASPDAVRMGAFVATLAFAVHPLRVESVAWVTERRDVLSGMFALVTVLAYLKAHTPETTHPARWRIAALLAFTLAIMSKSIVVSLPAVLLVLDAYPLRRIGWGRWREAVPAFREKLPFAALAAMGTLVAVLAARLNGIFTPLDSVSMSERLGLVTYSVWFYLSRTLAPLNLSPLHGLPPSLDLFQPRFIGSFVAVTLVVALAWRSRSWWPALPAALLSYLVLLAPVSGLLHNGAQIVAERYSYLSCMPWALLLGGAICWLARRCGPIPVGGRRLAMAAVAVWLLWLSGVTMGQIGVWRDTGTLWRATLAADPSCSACHYEYGIHLRKAGDPEGGMAHLTRALALRPTRENLLRYLVQSVLIRHSLDEVDKAQEELGVLMGLSPTAGEFVGRFVVTDW